MKAFLGAVLTGALVCAAIPAAATDPIKFKIATIAPADSPWDDALKGFKSALEKRSGGTMVAQLYMGGRLGSEAEMVKQVQFGSTECVGASTGSFAPLVPGLDAFELPFLWDSPEQAAEALAKLRPYFNEQFEKKGMHLVGWSENGWRDFMTEGKPILAVEDLKGLKIRSQESPMHMAFWQALGAKPVPLPTTDFEKAMKSGLVQGGDNSVVLTAAFGWNNAIKSFTQSRHIYQPAVVVCNKAWFDKLPAAERGNIDEFMSHIEDEVRGKLNAAEKEFLELFKSQGIEVQALSPEARKAFTEATASVRQKFAKNIPAPVVKVFEQVRGRKI
jgi:TRAP-type C4-dicarboxylate transport system substrate-binding protein